MLDSSIYLLMAAGLPLCTGTFASADKQQQPLASMVIRNNSFRNTFGLVRNYADGKRKAHQGWDLKAEVGTPIYAVCDSNDIKTGTHPNYGIFVMIKSNQSGYYYLYAHLSNRAKLGKTVRKGDVLGLTGISGNASNLPMGQAHLHFELRTKAVVGLGLKYRLSPAYGIGWSKTLITRDLKLTE